MGGMFILNACLGVWSAYRRRRSTTQRDRVELKTEHVQFMLLAVLTSLNAAAMRIVIMPTVFYFSLAGNHSAPPPHTTTVSAAAEAGWVSEGEWLYAKEMGYFMQAFLLVLPHCVPSFSPYATEVCHLLSGDW